MKLQIKLTLYNTLTKVAVVLFSAGVILVSLQQISYSHISHRLEDKKNEFLKQLRTGVIDSLLERDRSFIDYNILKDDYIHIYRVASQRITTVVDTFSTVKRKVDGAEETYRILSCKLNYHKKTYILEVGNTIDAVEQLKETIKGFTLLILFIALSLSLIGDLFFTKYLMNPFYQIIDKKLIRVNDPLNFDYEKITTSTDDFNLLDDSISGLMKKITGLFLLEKQFIANVSHELLTPISIISSRLENMLLHETLSEDAENKIFASLKTLNRLKSIINSLLLISQVENNQFNKNDRVNIADVIKEVYEELEDRLEDKELVFSNYVKARPVIAGNRDLIHTLLFNLINNAIKYNRKNGSITVAENLNSTNYQIILADTGIGMDDAQIDKAYNRFEKLNKDAPESFGLGLAIVKSIADFHNINILITSKKNAGTTITLIFKDEPQLH